MTNELWYDRYKDFYDLYKKAQPNELHALRLFCLGYLIALQNHDIISNEQYEEQSNLLD